MDRSSEDSFDYLERMQRRRAGQPVGPPRSDAELRADLDFEAQRRLSAPQAPGEVLVTVALPLASG